MVMPDIYGELCGVRKNKNVGTTVLVILLVLGIYFLYAGFLQ